MAPHCPQPCLEPFKMLVIPGASRPFPWGELRTSPVHVVPVSVPSALSLPGTVGAHLARVWQRRPKTKFVLCIRDPAYTEGLGRMWLRSPCGRGCSAPSAPHHPSKLQTCTHTRARVGTGAPGGRGAREGGESVHLPKTMSAPSQEKCITARQQWGAQRCQVPPAPCPGAAPQAQHRAPWVPCQQLFAS